MSKLKTAQELIKTNNSSVMAGFNMFIHGHPPITFGDGYHDAYDRMQGYEFAQKMAKEGDHIYKQAMDIFEYDDITQTFTNFSDMQNILDENVVEY